MAPPPVETASAKPLRSNVGLLDGVTVVEWGEFLSAPLCGRSLADLGAEVIKVEPPRGDVARQAPPFIREHRGPDASAFFQHLNLGKRGVSLDVTRPQGRDGLLRLLAKADLLIEAQRPSDMEAWSLGFPSLSRRFPGLSVVSITPFGQTGPYRDYHGADLVVWAMSGMAMANPRHVERPGQPPLKVPGYAADHVAAGFASAGATAALMQSLRTGRGVHVDISALDCLIGVMHVRIGAWDFDRRVETRTAPGGPLRSVPWGLFPCKDGYVGIFVVQDPQWEGLIKAMGSPGWATIDLFRTYVGRAQHGLDILELFQAWLDARTMEEVFDACQAHLVPACAVLTFQDVARSPQYLERRAWQEMEHPFLGALPVLRPPYLTPGVQWAPRRPAPALGQHNREVLVDWLGCDPILKTSPPPEAEDDAAS